MFEIFSIPGGAVKSSFEEGYSEGILHEAGSRTVTMKNGRFATEGKCPSCGTRMYRLGKD